MHSASNVAVVVAVEVTIVVTGKFPIVVTVTVVYMAGAQSIDWSLFCKLVQPAMLREVMSASLAILLVIQMLRRSNAAENITIPATRPKPVGSGASLGSTPSSHGLARILCSLCLL